MRIPEIAGKFLYSLKLYLVWNFVVKHLILAECPVYQITWSFLEQIKDQLLQPIALG